MKTIVPNRNGRRHLVQDAKLKTYKCLINSNVEIWQLDGPYRKIDHISTRRAFTESKHFWSNEREDSMKELENEYARILIELGNGQCSLETKALISKYITQESLADFRTIVRYDEECGKPQREKVHNDMVLWLKSMYNTALKKSKEEIIESLKNQQGNNYLPEINNIVRKASSMSKDEIMENIGNILQKMYQDGNKVIQKRVNVREIQENNLSAASSCLYSRDWKILFQSNKKQSFVLPDGVYLRDLLTKNRLVYSLSSFCCIEMGYPLVIPKYENIVRVQGLHWSEYPKVLGKLPLPVVYCSDILQSRIDGLNNEISDTAHQYVYGSTTDMLQSIIDTNWGSFIKIRM
jgi:hypothetical protein